MQGRAQHQCTYTVCRVSIRYLKKVHGPDHWLHGHEDVLEDQLDEPSFVIIAITCTVDNTHLLDEGRFARFSCACNREQKVSFDTWQFRDWEIASEMVFSLVQPKRIQYIKQLLRVYIVISLNKLYKCPSYISFIPQGKTFIVTTCFNL